ncbi:MAG: hypothetical protein RSC41_03075 [Oscillospiraceae bacterium]
MNCRHRDADGASTIIKNRCGICGALKNGTTEELETEMNGLKGYISEIEKQRDRYIEENKKLREIVKNMAKFI